MHACMHACMHVYVVYQICAYLFGECSLLLIIPLLFPLVQILQPVNIIMKIAPIQATTYLTIFGSLPIDVDQSFLT